MINLLVILQSIAAALGSYLVGQGCQARELIAIC